MITCLTTEQIETVCRELLACGPVTVRELQAALHRRFGSQGRTERLAEILRRLQPQGLSAVTTLTQILGSERLAAMGAIGSLAVILAAAVDAWLAQHPAADWGPAAAPKANPKPRPPPSPEQQAARRARQQVRAAARFNQGKVDGFYDSGRFAVRTGKHGGYYLRERLADGSYTYRSMTSGQRASFQKAHPWTMPQIRKRTSELHTDPHSHRRTSDKQTADELEEFTWLSRERDRLRRG